MRIVSFALLSILFLSCGHSLRYAFDAPLSKEEFTLRSNLLTGKLPSGWFTSDDTTISGSLEAWLLREDLSQAIIFRELHLDKQSIEHFHDDGLPYVAELSYSFFPDDSLQLLQEPEEYSLGTINFCSYEIQAGNELKRIVVFALNVRFFECEASTGNHTSGQQAFAELCLLQQSVLASLMPAQGLP